MYCTATFFVWGAYHVGVEAFEAVSTHIWSQSVYPCCVAVKGGKGFFLCNADNAGLFSGMVIWLVWRGQWSLHGCRLSNTRIPGSAGDEDWDVCIQSGCSYTTIISEIWGSQTDWQELKTCPQLWGFSRAEHFRHISRTRSIGPYSAHAPGGATESWEFLILGGYIGYTGLYMLTLYTLYCFTVYYIYSIVGTLIICPSLPLSGLQDSWHDEAAVHRCGVFFGTLPSPISCASCALRQELLGSKYDLLRRALRCFWPQRLCTFCPLVNLQCQALFRL